jgi:hypothetical protein
VLEGQLEVQEFKVKEVHKALGVTKVLKDHKGLKGQEDLKELLVQQDQLVRKVLLALMDLLEVEEPQVLKVLLARPVVQDHKEYKVLKELRVTKELRGLLDQEELLVLKVLKDHKVHRVREVLQVG